MSICRLSIITAVDGKENRAQFMGKLQRDNGGIRLRYREENAEVSLLIEEKTAWIKREGDYALNLRLREGERTEGSLRIGGSAGKILTETHFLNCEVKENEVEITLGYALLFDKEAQEMRLTITAKTRG